MLEKATDGITIPLHPGAEKYLKEKYNKIIFSDEHFSSCGRNIFPPGFLSRKILYIQIYTFILNHILFYLVQPDTVFASSNDDKILFT